MNLHSEECIRLESKIAEQEQTIQTLREHNAELEAHIKNAMDIGRGLRDAELGFTVPFEIVEGQVPVTYIRKSDLAEIKAERDRALSELAQVKKDTKRLDWVEENLDDVTVTRDLSAGVHWEITYCSTESGCQIEKRRTSFREAIDAARADNFNK